MKENNQDSYEKRFEYQQKTLWKPHKNVLLCTKDLLDTKSKRFIGVSALQKDSKKTWKDPMKNVFKTILKRCENLHEYCLKDQTFF